MIFMNAQLNFVHVSESWILSSIYMFVLSDMSLTNVSGRSCDQWIDVVSSQEEARCALILLCP
jgi:hypothetical protein